MNISKKRIAVNSIAHTVYSHFETPKSLMTLNDKETTALLMISEVSGRFLLP